MDGMPAYMDIGSYPSCPPRLVRAIQCICADENGKNISSRVDKEKKDQPRACIPFAVPAIVSNHI